MIVLSIREVRYEQVHFSEKLVAIDGSRLKAVNSRGSGVVGYNVQSAVDAKHHLIVAHDVSKVGSDRRQLSRMAKQAKQTLDTKKLTVVVDKGYYNGDELRECERSEPRSGSDENPR